jgi:hypothetical protein
MSNSARWRQLWLWRPAGIFQCRDWPEWNMSFWRGAVSISSTIRCHRQLHRRCYDTGASIAFVPGSTLRGDGTDPTHVHRRCCHGSSCHGGYATFGSHDPVLVGNQLHDNPAAWDRIFINKTRVNLVICIWLVHMLSNTPQVYNRLLGRHFQNWYLHVRVWRHPPAARWQT